MTNANALPHRKSLRPALLWATLCLILLGVLLSLLPGARLNSSVLAMLPKQTLGAIPPALNDGFMQRLDRLQLLHDGISAGHSLHTDGQHHRQDGG